ncbi:MAG: 2-dehydropantoate 2-reductase [Burkholderiaceae bacterium]
MKICVIGAGAIGGLIACRLAAQSEQTVSVSVLARGESLRVLQSNPLRVFSRTDPASDAWSEQVATVTAADQARELGPQDVVVVAVKYNGMASLASQIAPLIGEQTTVVSAMNGVPWWFTHGLSEAAANLSLDVVDPAGSVSAVMPAEQVIGCVVHLAASVREPGVIQLNMGNRLIFGEPKHRSSERLTLLCNLFRAAGFDVEQSDQIHHDVWYKLWGNMTMNPISAVTGALTTDVLNDPQLREFLSAAMREANLVGQRLGLDISEQPEQRHQVTLKLGGFKTSMLQDAQAGKPLELDALVTVVHDMARQLEIPAPNIGSVLGLARVFARAHGLTG